jgi:hypothetical protein
MSQSKTTKPNTTQSKKTHDNKPRIDKSEHIPKKEEGEQKEHQIQNQVTLLSIQTDPHEWVHDEPYWDCNSCDASINDESVNQRYEELKAAFP